MATDIFYRQTYHLVVLITLCGILYAVTKWYTGFFTGEFLAGTTIFWFWVAVAAAVLHQVYVWFIWRTQLKYQWLTRLYNDKGFKIYIIIFFVLFLSRLLFFVFAATANKDSLPMNDLIKWMLIVALSIPAIWLFFSVKRYFGFIRAAGADHFFEVYRRMPLVKGGIFKYTDNGMYLFGFLAFWALAVWFESFAALILAAFSHIYIWVHYYCTELPDMRSIYAGRDI